DSCDAYLYPGHVCAITGARVPRALTSRGISGVVAGFTASELLTALAVILRRSSAAPFFVNCYPRVVTEEGSPAARQLLETYFTPVDAEWRGLGVLPQSGLVPAPAYAEFDARRRYTIPPQEGRTNPACRCGDILRGACTPADCPLYGRTCTPEHPVGACMVSREGTCAAWYQYRGTSAASSGKEDLHG
ncbi:MAG: hydrogenase formation protein HypD, partial [Selenomonas sp.]|nr:hydrogenase formation protein HypD [Selenomonas sp.]